MHCSKFCQQYSETILLLILFDNTGTFNGTYHSREISNEGKGHEQVQEAV